MKLEDKLYLVSFRVDETSHLGVKDPGLCPPCRAPCVDGCPAGCWERAESGGTVRVAHEGCLECGTCRIVCPRGNVSWRYPRGGFGVRYSFG